MTFQSLRVFHNHIFWPASHTQQMVALYRRRFEHYGHGTADQAIVGLGGQGTARHSLVLERATGELAALTAGRRGLHVVRDEFADPVSFEELLKRAGSSPPA